MAVDYTLAPWLARQRTPGAGLLELLQLQQRQKQLGMEDQRTQMELQGASDRRASAAQSALARKTALDAIGQIPQDDPQRTSKITDIMRTAAMQTGPITAGMFPQPPPQVTDLTGGAGVPNPKAQPSPAFTSQLASILKSAGKPPVPPPPTGILPGSGKMITDSKGGVHVIPPRPLPQPRPAPTPPRPAAPVRPVQVPEGSRFVPGTNGVPPTYFVPPKSNAGTGASDRLTDKEFAVLPAADQTNVAASKAGAITNRLNSASSPSKDSPKSVPAGTKVTNGKGETKWTKTEGTLPDGWSPAQ